MTPREEILLRMKMTKQQMINAGPVHRRDLARHLKRLWKELNEYDRHRRNCDRVQGTCW